MINPTKRPPPITTPAAPPRKPNVIHIGAKSRLQRVAELVLLIAILLIGLVAVNQILARGIIRMNIEEQIAHLPPGDYTVVMVELTREGQATFQVVEGDDAGLEFTTKPPQIFTTQRFTLRVYAQDKGKEEDVILAE